MKFKNPRYQKIHDEINENRKKLGLKSVDESFEEWKAAGMPKHEEDGWAKRNFKEWMEDPRRDEIERNNKMMVESLREIEANLGKNQYKKEDRKKKSSKSKSKRKCRCKCK